MYVNIVNRLKMLSNLTKLCGYLGSRHREART